MAERRARARERLAQLGGFTALHLAIVALFVVLLLQVRARLSFPWDLVVWAESPFMSNMLKLDAGSPLYTAPSDVNSFVYAPALEHLTFALLRPLGMHLDVRACRTLSAVVGLLAALGAATAAARCALGPRRGGQTALFFVFALLLFKNFTADAPHPDNLHVLHFVLTFYLGLRAIEQRSVRWAVAAALLAGTGALVKQPAAGAFLGLLVGFAASRVFRARQLAVVAAIGLFASAAALAVLLVPEHARFWTVELILRHPLEGRLLGLFEDVYYQPYRLIVWSLGIAGAVRWWRAGSGERPALVLLLALGACEALPGLGGYFKVMGAWNNLGVIDVWLLLLSSPLLVRLLGERTHFAEPAEPSRALLGILGAVLIASLVPTRMGPPPEALRHAHELDRAVREDLAKGRRVLVAHGAMFHIRAGHRGVLLDRANSLLELIQGGMDGRAKTSERIAAAYYDRIYLNAPWFDEPSATAWKQHYRIERTIGPALAPRMDYRFGWQHLMPSVLVLMPRAEWESEHGGWPSELMRAP